MHSPTKIVASDLPIRTLLFRYLVIWLRDLLISLPGLFRNVKVAWCPPLAFIEVLLSPFSNIGVVFAKSGTSLAIH